MGLTRIRAGQVSNIGYTIVKVVALDNVIFTNGAPSTVDGTAVSNNDKILLVGQTDGSENGIYRVETVGTGNNGIWVRAVDFNQSGEIQAGLMVMVTEGTEYQDTLWKLITNDPIVVDETVLEFVQNAEFDFGTVVANGVAIVATTSSDTINFVTGNSVTITANVDTNSIEFDIIGGFGSPGGNVGEIQFNNNGIFGGTASLQFDGSNLTVSGNISAANFDSINADLAELYHSDQQYPPGTIVCFGGIDEITASTVYADPTVAGVISTAPAYTMNIGITGQPVAFQGRVPCRVVGNIKPGDLITTSNLHGVATRLDPADWVPGCVVGKSLGYHNSVYEGTIEVVVGRL